MVRQTLITGTHRYTTRLNMNDQEMDKKAMSLQPPMQENRPDSLARVVAVQESLVTIEAGWKDGKRLPLMKNEVLYIRPARASTVAYTERLKSETLRVRGDLADVQVFEDTSGVAVGDPVEQSGEMLSVVLGPGLLSQIYDGLQNPLEHIAHLHGSFLPRGVDLDALDQHKKWSSTLR